MYIIETGLKTGSFVNIMEIENKHIEDLIYSYLMGDISEEGRNELDPMKRSFFPDETAGGKDE